MKWKNVLKILVILAVFIVGMSCASAGFFDFMGGGNGNGNANTNNGGPLLTSGNYKVGDDLPPGEYYVQCTSSNLYVEVSSAPSNRIDDIVYNLNTEGGAYITLESGEYLEIDGGSLYELDDAPYIGPDEDGYYREGMYKVGKDIPEGQYKVESLGSSGYYEILSNSRHVDIVSNDYFESGTRTINLNNGEYLVLGMDTQIKA